MTTALKLFTQQIIANTRHECFMTCTQCTRVEVYEKYRVRILKDTEKTYTHCSCTKRTLVAAGLTPGESRLTKRQTSSRPLKLIALRGQHLARNAW